MFSAIQKYQQILRAFKPDRVISQAKLLGVNFKDQNFTKKQQLIQQILKLPEKQIEARVKTIQTTQLPPFRFEPKDFQKLNILNLNQNDLKKSFMEKSQKTDPNKLFLYQKTQLYLERLRFCQFFGVQNIIKSFQSVTIRDYTYNNQGVQNVLRAPLYKPLLSIYKKYQNQNVTDQVQLIKTFHFLKLFQQVEYERETFFNLQLKYVKNYEYYKFIFKLPENFTQYIDYYTQIFGQIDVLSLKEIAKQLKETQKTQQLQMILSHRYTIQNANFRVNCIEIYDSLMDKIKLLALKFGLIKPEIVTMLYYSSRVRHTLQRVFVQAENNIRDDFAQIPVDQRHQILEKGQTQLLKTFKSYNMQQFQHFFYYFKDVGITKQLTTNLLQLIQNKTFKRGTKRLFLHMLDYISVRQPIDVRKQFIQLILNQDYKDPVQLATALSIAQRYDRQDQYIAIYYKFSKIKEKVMYNQNNCAYLIIIAEKTQDKQIQKVLLEFIKMTFHEETLNKQKKYTDII